MKALTLTEPWGSLVAIGAKSIETRSWPTRYRGPVLIHAAKTFPADARGLAESDPFRSLLRRGLGAPAFVAADLPVGCVVATAELYACRATAALEHELLGVVAGLAGGGQDDEARADRANVELLAGDYSAGRWGFLLRDVRRLATPIPWRGMLGFWDVPTALAEAVAAQRHLQAVPA